MAIICIILNVLIIIAMWKTFVKANKPGWGALIPIYNIILYLQIAEKPVWWIILLLIPFVNFVVGILATVAFAKKFGKGGSFAVGLIFLPFIFYLILGFGSAQYCGAFGSVG